jgi:hypothetical protein
MSRNKKTADSAYNVPCNARISQQMAKLIKCKALEQNTSESEIVRTAITEYMTRTMNDAEIVHASLAEQTKKIRYLENKVELIALLVMQQTKLILRVMPDWNANTEEMVQVEYEKFMKDCTHTLRTNHHGALESMILDLYEQQEE